MRTRGNLGKGGLETPEQTPDRSLAQAPGTRVRDFDREASARLSARFAIAEILANFGGKFRRRGDESGSRCARARYAGAFGEGGSARAVQAAYLEK
jgi:hypothetical protein